MEEPAAAVERSRAQPDSSTVDRDAVPVHARQQEQPSAGVPVTPAGVDADPDDTRAARAFRLRQRKRARDDVPEVPNAAVERARAAATPAGPQPLTAAQRKAAARAAESPEAKAERLRRDRERKAALRAAMSPEEAGLRRAIDAQQRAIARAAMSPEDRGLQVAMDSHRNAESRAANRAAAPADDAAAAEPMLDEVMADTHDFICRPPAVPREWSVEDEVAAAAKLRAAMEARIPDQTCAVCARRRVSDDIMRMDVTDLPNLEVLSVDGPKSDACPRDALTTVEVAGRGKYCLDPAGVADGEASACTECLDCLRRGAVPPCSLVRVDAGPWPEDDEGPLPVPNYTEAKILAPWRLRRSIIVCTPGPQSTAHPDQRQKKGRGHCTAVPQPGPEKWQSFLPLPLDQLPEVINVVLLNAAGSDEEVRAMARRVRSVEVNGRTIMRWTRFLSRPGGYCDMVGATVAETELRAYARQTGVPDSVAAAAAAAPTEHRAFRMRQAFNRDRAGYVPRHDPRVAMPEPRREGAGGDGDGEASAAGDSDSASEDGDADDVDGAGDDDADVPDGGIMTGLTDIELVVSESAAEVDVEATLRQGVREVLETLHGGGSVTSIAAGGALQSDYAADFFVKTHPMSFPHGTGAVPAGMSRERYATLLVQRQLGRPLQFGGEDVPLFLALFNVTQRHRVLSETRVRMAGTPADFAKLDRVTAADAERVMRALANSTRGTALRSMLDDCDDPELASFLLSKARIASGRIAGTPGAMAVFSNKMTAMAYALGTFTVFPTFNNLEMRSPEVMRMCGLGYDHDELGRPLDGRPDAAARNVAVASHPAACAAFHGAAVDAVQEVAYGWQLGAPEQTNEDCLFGKVAAFAMKVETGGRGALHAHHLLVQDAMRPDRLDELFAGDTADAMFSFVNRLMRGYVPAGWTIDTTGRYAVAKPTQPTDVAPVPDGVLAADCRPPLDGSLSDAELFADQARCAAELQMHRHTARCRKGGHAGTDDDCAMRGTRVPHPKTSYEDGMLLARLDFPEMVFHSPTLSMALRCNNAVFLFAEQSRYVLERHLHAKAVAEGRAKEEDAPARPSTEDAAVDASLYAKKYAAKDDFKERSAEAFMLAAEALEARLSAPGAETPGARGLRLLRILINRQIGASSYPAAYAAHILLGGHDYAVSHNTAALPVAEFVHAVVPCVDDDARTNAFVPTASEAGRRAWASVYDNYQFRPPVLRDVSPYVYTMWFVLAPRQQDGTSGAGVRWDLAPGHPRFGSQVVRRRRVPVLPQVWFAPPPRPSADGPVDDDHQAYAAYMLGVLLPDFEWRQRLAAAEDDAWQALLEWERQERPASRAGQAFDVARRVQRNMDAMAAAQQRHNDNAIRYRAKCARMRDDAASLPTGAGRESDGSSADDASDDDLDEDAMPPVGGHVPGNDDQDLEGLLRPAESGAPQYVADMLGPLRGASDDGLQCSLAQGDAVRRVDAQDTADLRTAIAAGAAAAKRFNGFALQAAQPAPNSDDGAAGGATVAATPARLLAIARGEEPPLRTGQTVPYVRLPEVPTVAEAAALWTLNDKQRVAFEVLADVVLREKGGAPRSATPVRLIITGEPGTGKSRVLQALQWFALQHNAVKMVAVMAYTWRAALLLGTPDNPACTTTTFFAIDSFSKEGQQLLRMSGPAWEEVMRRLGTASGLRIIVMDEQSFISASHLSAISLRCQQATGNTDLPFGLMHIVLVGDPRQHEPPRAVPLIYDPSDEAEAARKAAARAAGVPYRKRRLTAQDSDGRQAYLSFRQVIMLDQQQRSHSSEAGQTLRRYASLFMGEHDGDAELVEEFCDAFNAKTPTTQQLGARLHEGPRVVTQRVKARAAINLQLALRVAAARGKRACVWLAVHSPLPPKKAATRYQQGDPAARVTPALQSALRIHGENKSDPLPSAFVFFEGAYYVFLDKEAVGAGAVHNAACIGRAIDLDPAEADDDVSQPFRLLRHAPLAVWVEPLEAPVPLADACGPIAPRDCMPIVPRWAGCSATIPTGAQPLVNGAHLKEWRGSRFMLPLGEGFAVTDYYAQGMSFRDDLWLAHLAVPDRGPMHRASVLVTLSRYRDWHAVLPWARLWPPGDDNRRRQVIDRFKITARHNPDLRREMARLRELQRSTLEDLSRRALG